MSTASWDLWDNIKKSGILVNVVSESGKRKTGMEKNLWRMTKNFSHFVEDRFTIQEAQWKLSKINTKKMNTLAHYNQTAENQRKKHIQSSISVYW